MAIIELLPKESMNNIFKTSSEFFCYFNDLNSHCDFESREVHFGTRGVSANECFDKRDVLVCGQFQTKEFRHMDI